MIDLYLRARRAKRGTIVQALEVKGSLTEAEADALETSVRESRARWR
ncbi:MAG: hypothetical protein ACJ79Y_07640 [Myxococcales bacterium]